MNKKENKKSVGAAEKMIEGIEDKYIEEAALFTSGSKYAHIYRRFRKTVAAAVICFAFAGVGVSVLAATNQKFRNWIQSNSANDNIYMDNLQTKNGAGVNITKEKDSDEKNSDKGESDNKIYYLTLKNIPDGYWCKDGEGCIYYGSNTDTDYFTVSYFHLQTEFTNVLPMAKSIIKYKTANGTACIAKSKRETKAWILFDDGPYMVEISDANKNLSEKQLRRLIDGASISTDKKNNLYEILEWTKKLQKSYLKWLEKYDETAS